MYRFVVGAVSVLAVVGGVILPGALPGSPTRDGPGLQVGAQERPSSGLDTASSAIPTSAIPTVSDSAQWTVRSRSVGAKAVASSVATSNCDGCAGRSTVFQVVYFDGAGAAAADNTAAAWSSCSGCASSAVSVQLVLARRAQPLALNNRAVALNVNCVQCTTTSAAIQFVIAGGSRRDLSSQAKALIAQIQTQLSDRLAPAAKSGGAPLRGQDAKGLVEDTASRLAAIILSDVGATLTKRSIDVQVGQ